MRFLPGTSTDSTISHGPFFADRRVHQAGRCRRFRRYLWDSEKRTVCNRTCTNWLLLILVYSSFLAILGGLFYLTLWMTVKHMKDNCPNRPQMDKLHLIEGGSPGLTFLPHITNLDLPLIWYMSSSRRAPAVLNYTQYLDQYFSAYEKTETDSTFHKCTADSPRPHGKLCLFEKGSMGPCAKQQYGYSDAKPCFYLKLNKLPGWKPEFYGSGDVLPADMPSDVKKLIVSGTGSKKYIWVNCKGVGPHDVQHLGEFRYYPQSGFFGDFFPYEGEPQFLSPLVAVQVDRYDSRIFVNIQCTVWAKNIKRTGPIAGNSVTEVNFYLEPK